MSPLHIQKTAAVAPAREIGSGQRSQSGQTATPAAGAEKPRDGVSVELSASVAGVAGQASAPVDADRVAEIREAIKDGSYPIVPARIADAVIAARLMLGYGE